MSPAHGHHGAAGYERAPDRPAGPGAGGRPAGVAGRRSDPLRRPRDRPRVTRAQPAAVRQPSGAIARRGRQRGRAAGPWSGGRREQSSTAASRSAARSATDAASSPPGPAGAGHTSGSSASSATRPAPAAPPHASSAALAAALSPRPHVRLLTCVCLCLLTTHIGSRPGSTVRPQPPAALRSAPCAGTGCSPSWRPRRTSWRSATATPRSPTGPAPSWPAPTGPTGCGRAPAATVRLRLLGADLVEGRCCRSGADWLLLHAGANDVLVPAHAVRRRRGGRGRPPRRSGGARADAAPWAAAWRVLARDRALVRVVRAGGSTRARRAGAGRAPTSWSSHPGAWTAGDRGRCWCRSPRSRSPTAPRRGLTCPDHAAASALRLRRPPAPRHRTGGPR